MSGAIDLDQLLASMQPELLPGTYVFATTEEPAAATAARMTFREAEGLTLILPSGEAERLGLRHEFPCRMITLNIHSSLEAVGFLARITQHLARRGMSVNPVSAFFHDHLFVPEDRAEEALAALGELAREARA